jgi:t-SNARE complex subunit (syntaxin)
MNTYLLEKADIFIYSVDTNPMREHLLTGQGKVLKELSLLFIKIVKERGAELKKWLTKSAQDLTGLIIRI